MPLPLLPPLLGLISKTGTECVVVLIPVVFCNLDDLQQE
jgi:hypothetical protein